MTDPLCPSCNSTSVELIGDLPDADRFAGVVQPIIIKGGSLFRCAECNLHFRHPRPDKRELDRLYRYATGDNWSSGNKGRTDWKVVSDLIQRYKPAGRVLDVGCFDGGFLLSLGGEYELFGVEVNSAAAKKARLSGINIVREDYKGLTSIDNTFDVIVALDVIEHVLDPKDFLFELISILSPGGIIILSTGNTDSPTWRFMGNRYWYCANPEHISYINPTWCNIVCKEMRVTVQEFQFFSYRSKGLYQKATDLIKNVFYRMCPNVFARLRMHGFGQRHVAEDRSLAYYPPTWLSAKDHFAVVIVKQ